MDHGMQLVHESFVSQRHTRNMNTELHGLIEDDILKGIILRAVRYQVLKYLVFTKAIIRAGIYGHMHNLDMHPDDIKRFRAKFRDVTY